MARMLVRSPAPHALQPPSASLGAVSCARREMIFAPTAVVRSQASACRCHHLVGADLTDSMAHVWPHRQTRQALNGHP